MSFHFFFVNRLERAQPDMQRDLAQFPAARFHRLHDLRSEM